MYSASISNRKTKNGVGKSNQTGGSIENNNRVLRKVNQIEPIVINADWFLSFLNQLMLKLRLDDDLFFNITRQIII